jgi:hypothetical protein
MTSGLELSEDEISSAREARWKVVGVTGVQADSLTVLKLGFGNGETEVVSLDRAGIENLVAVLKSVVPKFDAIQKTAPVPVNWDRAT